MELWKLIAAAPPLIVWFGLFLYLRNVETRLKKSEEAMQEWTARS